MAVAWDICESGKSARFSNPKLILTTQVEFHGDCHNLFGFNRLSQIQGVLLRNSLQSLKNLGPRTRWMMLSSRQAMFAETQAMFAETQAMFAETQAMFLHYV